MQRVLTMMIAALVPAACLPPPEDAGEVDPTETSGADGGASVTGSDDESSGMDGAPPADVDLDWSLELDPGLWVLHMTRTPQGVLVAFRSDPGAPAPYAEVREYSSTMELLWSAPLPNATISDLEVLGDGEVLAVGTSGGFGELVPTAWRLSCCAAAVVQSYPQDPYYANISAAALRGDGILLVIHRSGDDGHPVSDLVQVPLSLSPATSVELLPISIYEAARMADGNVLLRGRGHLDSSTFFYEVGPEGVDEGFSFGGAFGMIGKDDELTLMSFAEDVVAVQPFGENEWVQVPVPGLVADDGRFRLDRHARVAFVHGEGDSVGPSTLTLTEFDDDGVVARTLTIPHLQYEHADAHAIAVGEDDAIYLAVGESELGVGAAEYLHRIAPL